MKHKHFVKLILSIAVASVALPAVAADKLKAYRWIDDNGVYHYGDRVPPEFATSELTVLNSQGVEVARIDGKKTAEELAEDARQRAIRTEQIRKRDEALLRDRVLLSTYLSVEEIEALRDRRIELVAGQMRVIQIYLDNLREKLLKLEREAQRFSPYSANGNAPPIDETLARELSDTLDSIMLYERNMAKSRDEQTALLAKFDADINRFEKLHSYN
jgi:hypothetical protein